MSKKEMRAGGLLGECCRLGNDKWDFVLFESLQLPVGGGGKGKLAIKTMM